MGDSGLQNNKFLYLIISFLIAASPTILPSLDGFLVMEQYLIWIVMLVGRSLPYSLLVSIDVIVISCIYKFSHSFGMNHLAAG